jgi:hypothetical protein
MGMMNFVWFIAGFGSGWVFVSCVILFYLLQFGVLEFIVCSLPFSALSKQPCQECQWMFPLIQLKKVCFLSFG